MTISYTTTLANGFDSVANLNSVTNSNIVHFLGNYIGYGGLDMLKMAETELCSEKLESEFKIFYRDIQKVLYSNFKVKKNVKDYDDIDIANQIIGYRGGNDDDFYKNCLIAIIKVLQSVETEIRYYNDDEMLKIRHIFEGEATFLHLLLLYIQEFVGEVAIAKGERICCRINSRKKLLAQEVFDLAGRLPRMQTYSNEMTPMYESIFFIRQAIELKVAEVLCIEAVVKKESKRPIKISPDIFIKLLGNQAVKIQNSDGEEKELNIKFIKKVHSWTNLFIHSGNGYWFWEIEFVRLALQDFIFNDIVIENEYLKQIPNKVLQCVKKEERSDAEVIMAKRYYEILGKE